jgi:predicted nucleic acid-binding protein
MNAVFADTFYFLALLNQRDTAHGKAVEFASAGERPIVTTDWVLTEVADACAQPSKRQHFLDLMEMIEISTDVLFVAATRELFARGVVLFGERLDQDWPLTDCLSFVVMQERGITDALTGDRHFEQAGFKALLKR